jgi:hypothetical protein
VDRSVDPIPSRHKSRRERREHRKLGGQYLL